MSLGTRRRTFETQSSDNSLRDELYDHLLASLTQGGEPIASEEESWRWVESWRLTRRGEQLANLGDERMPWSIQRRKALSLLNMVDQETFVRIRRTMCGEYTLDRAKGREFSTPDCGETHLRGEWLMWSENMIENYRLAAVV